MQPELLGWMDLMDRQKIDEMIAEHQFWHHQIEFAHGIVSPGTSNSKGLLDHLDKMGLPLDCRGIRVLDLGCRDGFFSFELEKRGASVLPMDYVEPSHTGFPIAASILGSSLEYVVENIYFLDPERYGTFDQVLFLGLLYHLRNPMIALDRIRSVLNEGGLLWIETQLATDPNVLGSALPIWQFFPRNELNDDDTNMWGPNLPGLQRVLEDCEFDVLESVAFGDRGFVKARAVAEPRLRYIRELDSAAIRRSP